MNLSVERLEDRTQPSPLVAFLGDSITRGVWLPPRFSFPSDVRRDLGIRVVNLGVPGERSDQGLSRLPGALALHPRVAVVMYGTNDAVIDPGQSDGRNTPEEYRENLTELVSGLRAAGVTTVLMTPPRWRVGMDPDGSGQNPNVSLSRYVAVCAQVAWETHTPLVDNFGRWVVAERRGQNLDRWTVDNVHPNIYGHRQIAHLLLPVLEATLARLSPRPNPAR